MNLQQAITDLESAQTALGGADSAKVAADAKYEAAVAGKTTADTSDADAATLFDTACDSLAAAALASKLNRPPITVLPVPEQSAATAVANLYSATS